MSIKNLQIRSKNRHRLAKIAVCTSAAIIGSIIFKGISAQHRFHELGIQADDDTSISNELEEKYNIHFENTTLPCTEEIIQFIQSDQAYEEEQSVENRMNYVSSAKDLAYAADDMIKAKIQDATGIEKEEITLPAKRDKTTGNYIPVAVAEYQSYHLSDEIMDLVIASNEVTEYKGTGENKVWDNEINNFSNAAYKLFTEVLNSDYSLQLDGQDLSVAPIKTNHSSKGK